MIITVQLNKRDFEYDIHSLVRAFYPGSECIVSAERVPEEADLKISVFYEQNSIRIRMPSPEEGEEQNRSASVFACGGDRRQIKIVLKKLLYEMLRELTGQELPWGDLTGIRPTKIPMAMLRQGKSNAEIARHMRETYYVSPAKGALAISIANREKKLLDEIDCENGYSLYIGIPFCPSICLYCSFSSSPIERWKDRTDAYMDALCKEIDQCADMFRDRKLQTVYMGGGTPTTLESAQMDRLLKKIEERFDFSHLLEYTVEAGRPDSVTEDKLRVLAAHDIGRISINPQTMNQKTLDLIGRKHTVGQIREAFDLARGMGFDNINMDLIVGLPGEGIDEVKHTMEEIGALDPDSVTVHSLALKRAARLNLMKDQYQDISFKSSSEIMDLTMRSCEAGGLHPYYLYRQKNMAGNFENVGYAKDSKECLYNILIMEEVQSILALGAGASTKFVHAADRIERVENVKDIKNYIERIDEMIERKRQGGR